jgi:hypothetical protein
MKMSASRPEVTGKRFVSHREAAAMYGVCTKTIDRWVEQGILEPPTVINERKYHKIESLAEVGKISKSPSRARESAFWRAAASTSPRVLRRSE